MATRYLLAEVLVASFFLQLFALVTPLFFQIVIDKVLAHRSLPTRLEWPTPLNRQLE
jgi:subfamily B ATP-binding cassette protein HlyB/CyaB